MSNNATCFDKQASQNGPSLFQNGNLVIQGAKYTILPECAVLIIRQPITYEHCLPDRFLTHRRVGWLDYHRFLHHRSNDHILLAG